MTSACYIYSQSHLVEKAVYELVDTLKAGLADGDKKVLTAEEGYACLMPDHKNKKQRCQDCIACSYYTLLNYFTQRNTEALVKGITWLFAYCKGGTFNIHIWVWFVHFIC